jgi:hypothetical protein
MAAEGSRNPTLGNPTEPLNEYTLGSVLHPVGNLILPGGWFREP